MSRWPFPASLGELVAGWIERCCRHGPGDVYGKPVRLTEEEFRFLDGAYAIDRETGRRRIDEATYSRRKGLRKSEFGAWLVAAEMRGPVRARFGEDGKPEAGAPVDPWVLCAATTEDQGDLVYGAFRAIVEASDELRSFFDVGLETTYMTDRSGEVELVQSRNFTALDGGRPTFEVADETHLWKGPLRETYSTLRRNLRKRRESQPWILSLTTAWEIGASSIAETHYERAQRILEGLAPEGRSLFDHRQAAAHWNLDDPDELLAAIEEARGDGFWSDDESIAAEHGDPLVDEAEFRRYFLNQPSAPSRGKWIDAATWNARAANRKPPRKGTRIVLAFDGSYSGDSTALVGCTLDSHVFVVDSWENPLPGVAGWRVPRGEVQAKLEWAMGQWEVVELAPDPFTWVEEVEEWEAIWEETVVRFETNKPALFGPACTRFNEAVYEATMTHDGNESLGRHVGNALPKETGHGVVITKDNPGSPRKIDLAVAAVIAHERAVWHATHEEIAPPVPTFISLRREEN